MGLDGRRVGRVHLDELEVHDEPRRDEADADLGRGLEMLGVRDLDLLDAGPALRDLLGVDHERPDPVARRVDLHGAGELHRHSNARRRKAAIWPRVTLAVGQ